MYIYFTYTHTYRYIYIECVCVYLGHQVGMISPSPPQGELGQGQPRFLGQLRIALRGFSGRCTAVAVQGGTSTVQETERVPSGGLELRNP